MKVGTVAETNEKRKETILGILILAIICGLIFSGILQLLVVFFTWLIKLIIKHYVYILIGIAVILIGRKILFRAKRK